MTIGAEHGWSHTAKTGSTFADGWELLSLDPDEVPDGTVAVIEDIRFVGDEGLQLGDVLIAPPPRPIAQTNLIRHWPPRQKGSFDASTLVPAEGATVGVGGEQGALDTWELLMEITVEDEGVLRRTGVVIDYRIDEKRYSVELPAYLTVCTSRKYHVQGSCPF